MKSIVESIQGSEMVTEGVLKGRLSSNDKKNLQIIANALGQIVTEVSNWAEENDGEDTDTYEFVRQLSLLRDQCNGEWDEDITFSPYV